MRIFTYLLILIIVLLGLSFAVLNHAPVTINYYVGERNLPLSFLLVVSFAIGCIMGLAVGLGILFKLKLKNCKLHQHLKVAEKEVENLRAIPLQDRH